MEFTNEELEILIDGLCELGSQYYPAEYRPILNNLYDRLQDEADGRPLK